MTETNDLLKERFKKYEVLSSLGVDPFGGRFLKEGMIADLARTFEESKKVRTAGRLASIRLMGKTIFCDLKDETGRIQLYVKRDNLGDAGWQIFEQVDIGDIVGVEGELFKTKTGEITIRVQMLVVLAKSLRPMPEKWHGLKDTEVRYRRRYLDLISNDETKDIFKKRSLIVRSIRDVLDEKGYLEVETPMMHSIPGGAAGKPFKTHHEALDMDLFLRVAPELYLKKLLVGGFDKVYEINKSFRNEGISTRHNPEFTMIEVYTAYHDVNDVMDLTEEIIQKTAQNIFGTLKFPWGENGFIDFSKFVRVSFADLMKRNYGIVPEDETAVWIQKLSAKGVAIKGADVSRTQIINIVADLLDSMVRSPELAAPEGNVSYPVFVTDYFAEISPLAKRKEGHPHLADRFELYMGGMEIANGYSEQNNPIEQRQRFEEELREKGKDATSETIDEDFILALEHGMPPAGGLGIGIDRLVMVLTNQPSIREVILFPQMKAEKI